MRQPERHELRIKAEPLCFLVCHTCEMLQANERDTPTFHHELTRIGGADADHQHHIDIDVSSQQSSTTLLGVTRERENVSAFKHRTEITAIRVYRCVYNILKMWPFWIDDVVVPVRLEQAMVRGEVMFVGG